MINYAHRGASEYAPENTLSAFYLGLLQGANGIETDVQKTKDGVLVLFHDDTVDRISDATGRVSDFTLAGLQQLKLRGNSTTWFYDSVVTLQSFLEKFSAYPVHFAIELKGPEVEQPTLELIRAFGLMDRTTFTSFQFAYIQKIKALDANARVGWLTEQVDDAAIARLRSIGGEEIAPPASLLTPELMQKCRKAGLGVRAWGVTNVDWMKKMCALGVDGMTVNFPDRLQAYLNAGAR